MFLYSLLSLCLIISQSTQTLDENAILKEYSNKVPKIVEAYSKNIFVKERYTQNSDIGFSSEFPLVRTMYFCDQYVFTHISSSWREEVSYASNKAMFKILRPKNSTPWLLGYNITPKDSSHIETLRKACGQKSLDFPYKLWVGRIDVRDLLGFKNDVSPIHDKPGYDIQECKLVTIRKVTVDQHARYRFYYRRGDVLPQEMLDDIPCHGCFDIAPYLQWVIVAEKYLNAQTEITYEGEISGIPAIKKAAASNVGLSEPNMTYDILEISDQDKTNPAERSLEYYWHGSFLEKYGLSGPWYLLFFGAGGVFIIVAVFLQRKPSAVAKKPTA